MSKNRTGKCLTYEEIGEELEISPQQVHKIEKEAFNKLVKRLAVYPQSNIFEAILTLSEYLGIDADQAYKKLDKNNYDELCMYVQENYGKAVEGFVPPEANGLESFFE